MAAKHKFLFEKDFDNEEDEGSRPAPAFEAAPACAPAPAPEPPAPPVGEDELAAARQEGYRAGLAEGREAGRAEAEAAAEKAKAEAIEKAAQAFHALSAELHGAAETRSREALDVALRVVAKLFPALDRRHGLKEAEALIAHCLDRLREEPRVVVRVADALLDPLRARVDELAQRSGFAGKVVLLADETLAPCDVRVEWADGGAERDTERLWRDIEEAAARTFGARHETRTDTATAERRHADAGEDVNEPAPADRPVQATA